MVGIYQKLSAAFSLVLCIFFMTGIFGCTTVAVTGAALSSGLIAKDSNLKFSIKRVLGKAKNWVSNSNIKRSSDKDLQFAIQQFNQNNLKTSEFYLKKLLVKSPDNKTSINLLPWTYFYQKRYDKALKAFKRAKTYYPKKPETFIGMGWSYFGVKKYERAVEQFNYAMTFNGDPYQISKGKAFIYLKMNKENDAIKEFSKFFSPSQIKNILAIWKRWHKKDSDALVPIFPTTGGDISLFTLPSEKPRYPSTLLGLPRSGKQILEEAWEAYSKGLYEKALDKFSDMPNDNRSPDIKNGLAWSYLRNKEIKIASKLFQDILNVWPNHIGAINGIETIKNIKRSYALHADYYFNLNKFRIAKIKYIELKNEYPNWSYSYVQLGKIDLARNKYLNAREYFLDALDIEPNEPDAQKGIYEVRKIIDSSLFQADQALQSGDYKKAASIYANYIEDNQSNSPLTSKILDKLGFNETPWQEYKKQKSNIFFWPSFSKILELLGLSDSKNKLKYPLMPSNGGSLAHAYNGLGWSQFFKKKYLQAINKFGISRADREYFIESSRGLGLSLYKVGEFKRAADALKPVVKLNPSQLDIAYKLDMSILMGWDKVLAEKYFTETLTQYPLRASLYMGLGWLHYRDGNSDLGVEYFLKAISLDPDFALTEEFKTLLTKERFGWQVYNRFGWAYYEKKDYKNSLKMFQTSVKIQPNKSESRKGIGYTMGKMGKLAQAVKYLNQVLVLNPDPNPVIETISGNDAISPYIATTTARTTLGEIMLKQNNPIEAIALFQQELEIRPNLAVALNGLGWSYLKLNRLTESRTAFKAAIERQPLNNLTYKGLREVKQKIAASNMGNS